MITMTEIWNATNEAADKDAALLAYLETKTRADYDAHIQHLAGLYNPDHSISTTFFKHNAGVGSGMRWPDPDSVKWKSE